MSWLRDVMVAVDRGAGCVNAFLATGTLSRPGAVGADEAYRLAAGRDPWLDVHDRFSDPSTWDQLFIGIGPQARLITTAARTHSIVLGPPQSFKTAGVLCPQILFANGPVVCTSTKSDLYRATALARSRKGRLWHFAPDGSPPLPGTIPLQWSPIGPSSEWGTALMLGQSMANVAEVAEGTENAPFFRLKAGQLAACLLHAAGLAKKPMEWVLDAVAEDESRLREAETIMRAVGGYSNLGAGVLSGIMNLDGRTRGSIVATTSLAFSAYQLPGALETTRSPNFNEWDFVAGQPDVVNPGLLSAKRWREYDKTGNPGNAFGLYDTVYITASAQAQAFVAPLVVGLLSRIRQARYDVHERDARSGYKRPPTLFALDEVANIAPLGELPNILSEGSSQGLLTSCVMQDLVQAKARWKQHYEGFLTLFREVIAFPGIRNQETLEALSKLSGEVWEENFSGSTNWGEKEKSQSESVSEQRRVRFSPPEIYRGCAQDEDPAETDPRRMLMMASTGNTEWGFAAPYFYSSPVLEALIGVGENLAEHAKVGNWRLVLPVPLLRPEMSNQPGRLQARWQNVLAQLAAMT